MFGKNHLKSNNH